MGAKETKTEVQVNICLCFFGLFYLHT